MRKIVCKKKKKTRKDLANPFRHMSYHERLAKVKAVDLTDNFVVEDLGNGYDRIKPIDESKIVE
jgi:hypothetical protein